MTGSTLKVCVAITNKRACKDKAILDRGFVAAGVVAVGVVAAGVEPEGDKLQPLALRIRTTIFPNRRASANWWSFLRHLLAGRGSTTNGQ